jgi:hypothetical protein
MPKFNRTKVNLSIDLLLLIVFAALIGIGLLLKFVLISGQEKWLVYGSNPELTFLGLDRHEWGTVHLITGIVFFVLFILHLAFHWNMIKCMFRKCVPAKGLRAGLATVSLVLFTGLIVFPFFINPVKGPAGRGIEQFSLEELGIDVNDSIRLELKKPKRIEEERTDYELHLRKKNNPEQADITGKMTLQGISVKYDVSVKKLKEKLNIPDHVSKYERLGRMRKKYDFTLQELRDIIDEEMNK